MGQALSHQDDRAGSHRTSCPAAAHRQHSDPATAGQALLWPLEAAAAG